MVPPVFYSVKKEVYGYVLQCVWSALLINRTHVRDRPTVVVVVSACARICGFSLCLAAVSFF